MTMDAENLEGLRGNQEVFLGCIAQSPEFEEIKEKHLKNVFMALYSLYRRLDGLDSKADRKVLVCASEISEVFGISQENALNLLFLPVRSSSLNHLRYSPKVLRDGNEVVLRFGTKTTLKDIKVIWGVVRSVQREIGMVGSKKSINPELAYCIHKQYKMNGRKMVDVFDDYINRKLEGYNYPPTITDEHEFRKYYKDIVKGL